MKSIATRKKAIEMRLWEMSSRGMPDSTVVPLIRPPRWLPTNRLSRWEAMRMMAPSAIETPNASRTGKYCSGKGRSSCWSGRGKMHPDTAEAVHRERRRAREGCHKLRPETSGGGAEGRAAWRGGDPAKEPLGVPAARQKARTRDARDNRDGRDFKNNKDGTRLGIHRPCLSLRSLMSLAVFLAEAGLLVAAIGRAARRDGAADRLARGSRGRFQLLLLQMADRLAAEGEALGLLLHHALLSSRTGSTGRIAGRRRRRAASRGRAADDGLLGESAHGPLELIVPQAGEGLPAQSQTLRLLLHEASFVDHGP